jgi:hypothetical protein
MDLTLEERLPAVMDGDVALSPLQVAAGGQPPLVFNPPYPPAAIERLRRAQAELAAYGPEQTQQLALHRLRNQPQMVFRVLTRGNITAEEAMIEIQVGTPLGRHLAALQKRAALITLQAVIEKGQAPLSQ